MIDQAEPADRVFHCPLLGSTIRPRVCIARQLLTEPHVKPSKAKGWRGIGVDAPCYARVCATGAVLREVLGDACAQEVRHGRRSDAGDFAASVAELEANPRHDH